jgi:hypothetical protein
MSNPVELNEVVFSGAKSLYHEAIAGAKITLCGKPGGPARGVNPEPASLPPVGASYEWEWCKRCLSAARIGVAGGYYKVAG